MGVKERRQREREKRINSILQAAEKLILKEGFENFTLSRIAKEVELSRGIIYYYFINEENIIAKIIYDKMVRLEELLRGIPSNLNGFERIKSVLERFHSFLKSEPEYLSFISYFTTYKLANISKKSMPYYAEYSKMRDSIFNICLESVKKGLDDGSIVFDAPPHIITYAIWAGIGSFWDLMLKDDVLHPANISSKINPDEFLEEYLKMIYKALK